MASVKAFRGQKCGFDLILMDCNMPFLDGYEATILIREFLYSQGIKQPIIVAITGHSEPEYVKRAINAGMNQVLSKPVETLALKRLIKKLDLMPEK